MAFDETLAQRTRDIINDYPGKISEKKMFGGLAFMVNGNMCVGVLDKKLMARVGQDYYAQALKQPSVKKMDFTGKPLKGFIYVTAKGISNKRDLRKWIKRAHDFAGSLPAK